LPCRLGPPHQVKFAKTLDEDLVPEWRTAYVDYKRLKKLLKAVGDSQDTFGTTATVSSSDGVATPPLTPRNRAADERGHGSGTSTPEGNNSSASQSHFASYHLLQRNLSVTRSNTGGSWTTGLRGKGGPGSASGGSLGSGRGGGGSVVIHVELQAPPGHAASTLKCPVTHVADRTPAGRTRGVGELTAFWSGLDGEVTKVCLFLDEHSRLFEQRFEDIMAALRRHRDFVSAARHRDEAAMLRGIGASPDAAVHNTPAGKPQGGGTLRRRGSSPGDVGGTRASHGGDYNDGDYNNAKPSAMMAAAAAAGPSSDFFLMPPGDDDSSASALLPTPQQSSAPPHHGVHFSLGGVELTLSDSDADACSDVEAGSGEQGSLDVVPLHHGVAAVMAMHHTAQAAPSDVVAPPQPAAAAVTPSPGGIHLPHVPLPHLVMPHMPHMHLPHVQLADGNVAKRDGRQLRRALTECYRGVLLLAAYVRLNQTALHKILKKHDKVTGYACEATYLAAAERCNWSAVVLTCDSLCRGMEREFEALEQCLAEQQWRAPRHRAEVAVQPQGRFAWARPLLGDAADMSTPDDGAASRSRLTRRDARRHALAKLRPPQPRVPGSGTLLAAGFTAGGCVAAAANVAVLWTQASASPVAGARARALLPVLRGPLLVALHMFLHGCAVAAWSSGRISYAFIFGSVPGTEMAFAEYLLLAGLFAAGWLVSWAGILTRLLAANPESQDVAQSTGLVPFAILLIAALLFAVPLPSNLPQWPPRTSRSFFSDVAWRTLTAPLTTVRLPHLFLADQLVSQIPAVCDLVYATAWFTSGAYARGDGSAFRLPPSARLAIALLPSWLRMAQCLRRFRDEGAKLHLVNTGKYATGAAASVTRYWRDTRGMGSGAWTGIAAAVQLASSAYSFVWDVRMDWGLGRWASHHVLLRDTLMLGRSSKHPGVLYACVILLNALLRLTWLLPLFAAPAIGGSVAVSTIVAALEVTRRCMWNVFRVENEHVANMAHHRATANVPLPKIKRLKNNRSGGSSSGRVGGSLAHASSTSLPSAGGLAIQQRDALVEDGPEVEMQPLMLSDSLSADAESNSAQEDLAPMGFAASTTLPPRKAGGAAGGFMADAVMPRDWAPPSSGRWQGRRAGGSVAEDAPGEEHPDSVSTWDATTGMLALLGTGMRPPPASRRPTLASVFEDKVDGGVTKGSAASSPGDDGAGDVEPGGMPHAASTRGGSPAGVGVPATVSRASLRELHPRPKGEHFDWRDEEPGSSSDDDSGGED
jgi:hypothetical protein